MQTLSIERILFSVLLILLFTMPFYAQTTKEEVKDKAFYIGIQADYINFSGDSFDGLHYFIDEYQIMLIPKLEAGTGFGLVGGYSMPGGAVEFAFRAVPMSASFAGAGGNADFNILSGRTKIYLTSEGQVTPYVLLGFNYAWLNLEDGSATTAEPVIVGDVLYSGFGFECGLGIAVSIIPEVSVYASGIYHIEFYLFGGGVADDTAYYLGYENIFTGYNLDLNIGLMILF